MVAESNDQSADSLGEISHIIDSSALTKYAAKEGGWDRIGEYLAKSDSLELALTETGNALWKKIQRKEVSLESAKTILRTLADSIWFLDERKYLERALEIANQYHVTVYDSLFLACAEAENSDLVSCDGSQIKVAGRLGIRTIAV